MNGKQLKNSILQWAIQGKLVPQAPNDEPASVLLDKIRQEKERLIKEKKIKRDKNASIIYRGEDNSYYEKILATGEVKCIDEEIPFEVPKGWEWCRVSAVSCSIVDGDHMPPPKSFQGIPFIVISNITMGYLDLNTSRYVPESYFRTLSQERVPQVGDILFSVTGSYGIAVRINTNCKFCFQRHIALIRPMSINSEYLEFLLNSAFIKKQCDTVATGMAQKTVGIDSLRKLIIPIPPTQEQGSIVAKLKLLMPLVRKYSMMQEKLDRLDANIKDRLYNSILQDAIKGWPTCPKLYKFCHRDSRDNAIVLLEQIKTEKQKLVKEGKLKKSTLNDSIIFRGDDNRYYEKIGKKCVDITEEIPFEIPNNWAWSRLSSMCSIVNGFTPLRSESRFWDCGTINWFTVEDIKNQGEIIYSTKQKITDEATSKERIVRAGSVLLCCTASVGQCALAKIDLTTNQQFNALTVKDVNSSILTDNYLFWFAKTLKQTLHRLSGKTTFEFVSVKKVGNILIPLPPLKEQQRIVAQIEKLFEQLH